MNDVVHVGGDDWKILEVPMTADQRERGWQRSGVLIRVKPEEDGTLWVHDGDWSTLTAEQQALVGEVIP